ncbi:uncharacterized protein A4U43_C03F9890 [Asparagus officinalis]|uniref:Uncharacterized protein n=1 Tax=Asparagus officinalis TaxID=4686 RepID=A0A5P1F9C7_ASPOF|nr:uncharacterized protein A4U43_C03F9890 [Asparagus officinalis]
MIRVRLSGYLIASLHPLVPVLERSLSCCRSRYRSLVIMKLKSSDNLCYTETQKQPPSSSHLHSQLKNLHRSLHQLANKQLKFNTQLLTQLKDVAYDASELVDDLEYEALRQEVEEFNRLNPNKPITGPSISQFTGLQTGDPHTSNRGGGGVPALDSVDAQDVSCSGAIEDRIAIIVEKMDYFAAILEGTIDQDNNNEVVNPVITGDVCAANNIVDYRPRRSLKW